MASCSAIKWREGWQGVDPLGLAGNQLIGSEQLFTFQTLVFLSWVLLLLFFFLIEKEILYYKKRQPLRALTEQGTSVSSQSSLVACSFAVFRAGATEQVAYGHW